MSNLTLKEIKSKLINDRNWNNVLMPTFEESTGEFTFEYHSLENEYNILSLHVYYKGNYKGMVTIRVNLIVDDTIEFKNKMLIDIINRIKE